LEDEFVHIGNTCIVTAAVFGVIGMAMGLFMGIGGDFSLSHAHSHINLVGWVTLAIYGLYHRGFVRKRYSPAWIQAVLALVATPIFTLALTAYLVSGTQIKAFIIVAMLSGILVAISMALFLFVAIQDARSVVGNAST
jgi:drug/metabolite transporter (DMT)-like permease